MGRPWSWWVRPRSERGTSAIEFAFVGPLLLLIIFSTVWFGLYFYGRNVALTAAREGVSYLRLAGANADPQAFSGEAQRVSLIYATRIGVLKGAAARSVIDEDSGLVTMTVTGYIDVPGMRPEVTQTVTATLEQFRSDGSTAPGYAGGVPPRPPGAVEPTPEEPGAVDPGTGEPGAEDPGAEDPGGEPPPAGDEDLVP